MDKELLNQALKMTIDDLSSHSSGLTIANNYLNLQVKVLTEEKQKLQARVTELEALLDETTQPAKKEK